MENYSIVMFIMTIMIALSAMADKIKLPYPILLISAGIAIGFLPFLPNVELNPEIVFLLFLPPLLYDSAFNISFAQFKTNIVTISTLSVTLVFATTLMIAVVAHYLIPGMSWPLAFVLGAILSATDAVAAMSITKGLGLSHKTTTILEGESLVNDASALVAYRFAVAAVTGASFVFWRATVEFGIVLAGGFVVGAATGWILAFILGRIKENNMATIGFMLLMPFVSYLIAEELHVSGVIAVVILGLSISRYGNKVFSDKLKQESKSIWDVIVFLLNGLIFILIGLQFPFIIKEIDHELIFPMVGYAFAITVFTLVLRMAWMFFQRRSLQKNFRKGHKSVPEDALLDFKNSIIIGWSGMRGIVSLAIAIGLPAKLADGSPFPERNTIIFVSIVVVLFTLIGQGLTLPILIKRLKIE